MFSYRWVHVGDDLANDIGPARNLGAVKRVCTNTYAHSHPCVCPCVRVCTSMCVCVCACVRACLRACLPASSLPPLSPHTNKHTNTLTCTHRHTDTDTHTISLSLSPVLSLSFSLSPSLSLLLSLLLSLSLSLALSNKRMDLSLSFRGGVVETSCALAAYRWATSNPQTILITLITRSIVLMTLNNPLGVASRSTCSWM